MTECSSVGRAIDCSVEYCVSVFSEINWSLVRFRPLGFCLEVFTCVSRPPLSASARPCLLLCGQEAMLLSVSQGSGREERIPSPWCRARPSSDLAFVSAGSVYVLFTRLCSPHRRVSTGSLSSMEHSLLLPNIQNKETAIASEFVNTTRSRLHFLLSTRSDVQAIPRDWCRN